MSTSFRTNNHVRNEIKFDHVENWDVNAPQTEEEARRESRGLIARNRLVEEHYHRELSRLPGHTFARAVSRRRSSLSFGGHTFRNVYVNAESGLATCDQNGCGTFLRVSKYPYENSIEDMTHHLATRERLLPYSTFPPRRPRRFRATLRRCWIQARRCAGSRTDSFPSPAPP